MAIVENFLSIPNLVAGQNMSGKQYRGVKTDTDDFEITGITGATSDHPLGILQNDPTEGQEAIVAHTGVCKAEAGGVIAVGNPLALNDDGDVIADVEIADGGTKDLHHIGIALMAGVNLQVIWILLKPAHRLGSSLD